MQVGDLLDNRFSILRPVGKGGMGVVFHALDRVEGTPVAVKVMSSVGVDAMDRFRREARLLAEFTHSGIVRYVASGETHDREPYLVMEWLEGQDLAARLVDAPLDDDASLLVVTRAAEALAVAHEKGIVHRDIKPANLFLVDGSPARVKLLDFGVAKHGSNTQALTMTGAHLGTFGYMAPEQAMGSRDADARADVYALGCVLYLCLTGRPPIVADNAVALLAKTLLEVPPRLRELRPELPLELSDLLMRMLAKEPEQRPLDAGAVLQELGRVNSSRRGVPASHAPPSRKSIEPRLVSVLLARLEQEPARNAAATFVDQESVALVAMDNLARQYGGSVARLPGSTYLFTLPGGSGSAKDQAARAARCAVELRAVRPGAAVALATGFVHGADRQPVGAVIDRSAVLLSAQSDSGAALDELTASLVDGQFEVKELEGVWRLGASRPDEDAARTLLGKQTPCVGRDAELAMFAAVLEKCIAESSPRAVLVTAPPGTGKSRLGQEFLRRVREGYGVRIVFARADSMSDGSAFMLARQIVRQTSGLVPALPPGVHLDTLRQRLATHMSSTEARVNAEFLCELLGVNIEASEGSVLFSARSDPRLMADRLRRSFEEWLRVEARKPLLIVLDDLHWGDAPTVDYLEGVLKEFELPLLIYGSARPSVYDVFPRIWSKVNLLEVRLPGLSKRAAETLVRAVLDDPDTQTVARVVESAHGNPFYLEELVRAVAEGRGEKLPDSVLAMVHARLELLDPRARIVLRAASVFGERFWVSGVTALATDEHEVESWLSRLEQLELVARSRGDRFAREREYAFRHALVRDAVYATLGEEDARAAHRLAASWLMKVGEKDPLMIADHFALGGAPLEAIPYLEQEGRSAIQRSGHADAIVQYHRALEILAAVPEGEARERKELALRLALGSPLMAVKGYANPEVESNYARVVELCSALGDDQQLFAALLGQWQFSMVRGRLPTSVELGRQLLNRAELGGSATSRILAHRALATTCLLIGDLAGALEQSALGLALYQRAEHGRLALRFGLDPGVAHGLYRGWALWLSGNADRGLAASEAALRLAEAIEHPVSVAFALCYLGVVRMHRGEHTVALEHANRAATLSAEHKLALWTAMSAIVQGWARSALGETAAGLALMREGTESWRRTGARAGVTFFNAALGWALLRAGLGDEAEQVIDEGMAIEQENGEFFFHAELLRLSGEAALQNAARAGGAPSPEARAEQRFREARACARSQAAGAFELRVALSHARLLQANARTSEALALLEPIRVGLDEGAGTADLLAADALLRALRRQAQRTEA